MGKTEDALLRAASAPGFKTQVSFDPPPWLELTTYDPGRSATRVRPPGSTQTSSPLLTANGRRSAWRGRIPSSTRVGIVESMTTAERAAMQMQIFGRDIRLAENDADAGAALEQLRGVVAELQRSIDGALPKMAIAENKQRAERVKSLAADYMAAAGELVGASAERKEQLARERTRPAAREMTKTLREVIVSAR